VTTDYRRLNDITTPVFNHLIVGKKIFSTLDLKRVYNQIPINAYEL